MAVLEGAWNCAQCGTKEIPGLTHMCPTCGDPHNDQLDPSESFYLHANAKAITDPKKLQIADSGAKWNCGGCNVPNLGTDSICGECKRPRDADDFVTPVTRYVSGESAKGETLSRHGVLEEDWVDATLQRADKLQQLEEESVTQPVRVLAAANLPTKGRPQYGSSSNGDSSGGISDSGEPSISNKSMFGPLAGMPKRTILQVAAVMLAIVALAFIGAWVYKEFIATKTVQVTVQSLSWQRQIEVEELRTLTQEDWSVPSDGRVISSRQEIHHYVEVFDHYETRYRTETERVKVGTRSEEYACGSETVNRGNGSFETKTKYCEREVDIYDTRTTKVPYQHEVTRQEPVYETRYRYEVDRWVTDHWDETSSDTHGPKPVWPEVTIRNNKQREGNERRETYIAELVDTEGRIARKTATEAQWSGLKVGQVLQAEQTRRGSLVSVQWT